MLNVDGRCPNFVDCVEIFPALLLLQISLRSFLYFWIIFCRENERYSIYQGSWWILDWNLWSKKNRNCDSKFFLGLRYPLQVQTLIFYSVAFIFRASPCMQLFTKYDLFCLSLFRVKGFLMFITMKSSDCCCRPGSCVINFHISTDFNWVFAPEESVVFFLSFPSRMNNVVRPE